MEFVKWYVQDVGNFLKVIFYQEGVALARVEFGANAEKGAGFRVMRMVHCGCM